MGQGAALRTTNSNKGQRLLTVEQDELPMLILLSVSLFQFYCCVTTAGVLTFFASASES